MRCLEWIMSAAYSKHNMNTLTDWHFQWGLFLTVCVLYVDIFFTRQHKNASSLSYYFWKIYLQIFSIFCAYLTQLKQIPLH